MAKPELPGIRRETEVKGQQPLTLFLENPQAREVGLTGGKGASLSELRSIPNIKVPDAFVVVSSLSGQILDQNPSIKEKIRQLDEFSVKWVRSKINGDEITAEKLGEEISQMGKQIKEGMESLTVSPDAKQEIINSYEELGRRAGKENVRVAVRSSGVCEDGSEFSFAGQNKTDLHREGEEEVLKSTVGCIASQFGERAIEYRNEARLKLANRFLTINEGGIDEALAISNNFSHTESRLAVVVQEMVDGEAAGIGFSVDSATGANITRLDINYGLGEAIVSGSVTPDCYEIDPKTGSIIYRSLGEKAIKTTYVKGGTQEVEVSLSERNKFAISDEIVKKIADQISLIREHYAKKLNTAKVDTEFVVKNGEIYLTQARPETVSSGKDPMVIEMRELALDQTAAKNAELVLKAGKMGSPGAASGKVMYVENLEEAKQFLAKEDNKGKDVILVTHMTSPDWVPVMKKVKGIVTKVGGDKCHAAIVSRELRVPCIVGAGNAIEKLKGIDTITIDSRNTAVYKEKLPLLEVGENMDVREFIDNPTKTTKGLILANPDEAKRLHALGELGKDFKVSLLRAEFLLGDIGVHVNALVDYDRGTLGTGLKEEEASILREAVRKKLEESGYTSGKDYFIDKYSEGISRFAAIFPNSEIVLRTTDYKTNEYSGLIGGAYYEPTEENPMMGVRGLPRFLMPENRDGFRWELEAIKKARGNGYKNIEVMFPMVRDPLELSGSADEMEKMYGKGFRCAYDIMKEVGLERGKDGLKTLIMVENPANVIRLDEFIDAGIDGISIGSNDLTQLTLGVDRDNDELGKISQYSEMNPAVIKSVKLVLRLCKERGVETGICGNAPSNHPEFVKMLVEGGIDSIGVTQDRFLPTHRLIKNAEGNLGKFNVGETVIYNAVQEHKGNGSGQHPINSGLNSANF